jgi:hypothetical protein
MVFAGYLVYNLQEHASFLQVNAPLEDARGTLLVEFIVKESVGHSFPNNLIWIELIILRILLLR